MTQIADEKIKMRRKKKKKKNCEAIFAHVITTYRKTDRKVATLHEKEITESTLLLLSTPPLFRIANNCSVIY